MELVVILVIVALAVVLIGGGLYLSRRSTSTDKGLPEKTRPAPAAPKTRPAPSAPPKTAPPAVTAPPTAEPEVEEPEAEPEPEVVERVKPRLRDRLGKTRAAFAGAFAGIAGRGKVDEETWDDLEEALILADVGVPTTTKVIEAVRERAKAEKVADPERVIELLREELVTLLADADRELRHGDAKPSVWMFVGVNGVGKTTSIAKLAQRENDEGRRVVLAAADTFRAAAAEQLATWADRTGTEIIRGQEGADPGSVVFDAMAAATTRGADLVLVDTAGRLHTKINLMEELKKLRRIVERTDGALCEVLLVVDASTGQNGLTQARQFAEAVDVTGVVLTKLDGTAKGGIVLAIQSELGIPVKVVGIGETADDLVPFEPEEFVAALF
jgi:fused signal recognition particle receptor